MADGAILWAEAWRGILPPRLLGILVAIGLIAQIATATAAPKKQGEQDLPPTPARLWVVAPSARGPWLLRIDNEGDVPIRVPADVRLLRFEVRPLVKNKWRRRAEWPRRAKVCDGPEAFGLRNKFPHQREIVLEPGQSFVEQFDPRLICFGKQAELLAGGSLVKPSLGWKPRPKWSRRQEKPPFAADTAKRPRRYAPLKRLEAPTMLLSYMPPPYPWGDDHPDPDKADKKLAAERAKKKGAQAGAPGPGEEGAGEDGGSARSGPGGHGNDPQGASGRAGRGQEKGRRAGRKGGRHGPHHGKGRRPRTEGDAADAGGTDRPRRRGRIKDKLGVPDELAAQLALETQQYDDAQHPRNIVVSVTMRNVGERPRRVALRRRQLSFTIVGPDGVRTCPRRSVQHVIPPDLFRKFSQGKKVKMSVQLAELCPWDTFKRPGIYVVTPTIHATETDRERRVDALTATVSSRDRRPTEESKEKKRDPEEHRTLVRVKRGMEPYYARPPILVPTRFFKIGEEAYRREQEARAGEQDAAAGAQGEGDASPGP